MSEPCSSHHPPARIVSTSAPTLPATPREPAPRHPPPLPPPPRRPLPAPPHQFAQGCLAAAHARSRLRAGEPLQITEGGRLLLTRAQAATQRFEQMPQPCAIVELVGEVAFHAGADLGCIWSAARSTARI